MNVVLQEGAPHHYRREARTVRLGDVTGIEFACAQMSEEVSPLNFAYPPTDVVLFLPYEELQALVRALGGSL